ncbi:MAG: polysaccharide biosynthesis/export family protein [Caulobacteraceae bacterium]
MSRPIQRPAAAFAATGLALVLGVSLAATLAGCATPQPLRRSLIGATQGGGFNNIGYATWGPDEPAYRMYPGDVLDLTFPSAPELNREVTVQPDGRIALPLVAPVMAADRSTPELQALLSQAYASQLVRPEVDVMVKTASPLRVFIGGEVQKPGIFDMPGDINALQAVVMAGGFTNLAKRHDVVVIRRGEGGRPMMRLVDLREAVFNAPGVDAVPLRRFDVIYVPRTNVGNAGIFMEQYIRDLIPIQFSYALSPTTYAGVP